MEEPILSRLVRLDNILKHLEDVRSVNHSPGSSCYASATSSDGRSSSHVECFSPKGRCRPVEEVMLEVQSKGTLIERLVHAEDRILKLCLQLENEFEGEREKEQTASSSSSQKNKKMPTPNKGLKQLVKSCVIGRNKNKHKNVV